MPHTFGFAHRRRCHGFVIHHVPLYHGGGTMRYHQNRQVRGDGREHQLMVGLTFGLTGHCGRGTLSGHLFITLEMGIMFSTGLTANIIGVWHPVGHRWRCDPWGGGNPRG